VTFLDSDKLGIGPIGANPIAWGPLATTCPRLIMAMRPAERMVESRCAMTRVCARHQAGYGGLEQPLVLYFRARGWLYHTVLTKVEACRVGSFRNQIQVHNRAVPAITGVNVTLNVINVCAAWITAKLIRISANAGIPP